MTPPEHLAFGQVCLRRWRRTDLKALLAASQASWQHLQPWMAWAQAEPDEQWSLAYLERAEARWETAEAFLYAMVDAPASSTVLGSCGLMRRNGEGGHQIGYWVHANHTRRGLATAAVTALTSAGLRLPAVDHIEIHTDPANAPSRALAARLGYEHVATRPRDPQAPADTGQDEIWRITSAQWSPTKAAES